MAKRTDTLDGRDKAVPRSSRSDPPSLGRGDVLKCPEPLTSPDGAESVDVPVTDDETMDKSEGDVLECAICLQTCMHPVQLPCSHIFCFLCVKGVAIQSKRCALCRQDIPVDFFNNPALLRKDELYKESVYEGCYQWYYQGNNGWWQYDERASSEIEECFKAGNKHLEILIAGFLYIIDYDNMLQFRRNDPSRRRKIKRDLLSIPDRKGVAGLKVKSRSPEPSAPHRLDGDGGENVPCVVQTKQPKQKSKTVATRASNSSATRAVPGQAAKDQTAPVGQSTLQTQMTPGQASQSRLPNKSPRTDPLFKTNNASPSVPHNTPEGQLQIEPVRGSTNPFEETTDDVIDSLSSHVSNIQLSETPSASRISRRTRSSRSKRNSRPAEAQLQPPSSSDEEWQ